MKRVKVTIEFEIKGDVDDEDAVAESIQDFLEEAIEAEDLRDYCNTEQMEDDEEDCE